MSTRREQNARSVDAAREPTRAELAAIDREWPVIAAELGVVDAEIAIVNADGDPSPLDGHRLERAEQLVRDATARQQSRPRSRRRSA